VDGYIHTKRKMAKTTKNTLKIFFYWWNIVIYIHVVSFIHSK
jgi:hypothetical protein